MLLITEKLNKIKAVEPEKWILGDRTDIKKIFIIRLILMKICTHVSPLCPPQKPLVGVKDTDTNDNTSCAPM